MLLPGPASDHDSPTPTSQVAGVTGSHLHTRPCIPYLFSEANVMHNGFSGHT
jgi:hypothetical protein